MSDKKFLWVHIVLLSYLINFTAILLNRIILETPVSKEDMIGFILISIVISSVLISGYFSFKIFAKVYALSNIIAIGFLISIAMFKTSEHWSDLTSIVTYLLVIALGFFMGLLIQLIYCIRAYKKTNDENIVVTPIEVKNLKNEINVIEEKIAKPKKKSASKTRKAPSKKKAAKKKSTKKRV